MHRKTINRILLAASLLMATALLAVALSLVAIPLELVVAVSLVAVGWVVVDAVRRHRGVVRPPAAASDHRDEAPARSHVDISVPESVVEVSPRPDVDLRAALSGAFDEPSSDEASPRTESSVVSIEPPDVVGSATADLVEVADVVSTGLWLEDSATATLRLVVGGGEIPPTDAPMEFTEGPAFEAVERAGVAEGPLADISRGQGVERVSRYAVGIHTRSGGRGAFVADVTADDPSQAIEDILIRWQPALAASLELHVARHDAAVARELIEAARHLSRSIDPADVLDTTIARAVAMAGAETASIMLVGDDGTMTIHRSTGLPAEVVEETKVTVGEGIAGWVLATDKPLLVEDLPRHEQRSPRRGVRSAVSVPISDEEGTLGVLNVGSKAFPARFTQAHLDAMEVLGRQACVAYRNALAVGEARDLYLSTLRTLAVAMETKDPYARGCTDRVLEGVRALARSMELSDDDRRAVEVAALFHDMGMSAAGDGVRSQDRPLTTVERGLLKMHPVIAAEVLAEAPALRDVAAIVYHHHERFDGHGYVGGLEGSAIPIGARVLAVVDAFVAMTSSRPYRTAMDAGGAVEELRQHAGTQFDPDAVEAFVALLEEDGIPVRDGPDSN